MPNILRRGTNCILPGNIGPCFLGKEVLVWVYVKLRILVPHDHLGSQKLRVRFKDECLKGALIGSLSLASKSGWMTAELFPEVLKHIKQHTNCSKDDPILLLFDNHDSHCSIEAIPT